MSMKIRIGIGLGDWPFAAEDPAGLFDFVDRCEALEIDSLWVSDRIVSAKVTMEPIVLMAYMASRVRNMKFGTSALVLPTRNPVLLAKQLATLDFLCRGSLLLVVGLGSDESGDFDAVGVRKQERGKRADESIELMRKLWSEGQVNFEGEFYSVKEVSLLPRPWRKGGPPIWVGGRSRAALRRAGRLADGWLVSSAPPNEVAEGIRLIREYAAQSGRTVPEDHYGVVVPFFFSENGERAWEIAGASIRTRPGLSPHAYCALGRPEAARQKLQDYVDAGATKFVMRLCGPREFLGEQIEILAREIIGPLQSPFDDRERAERSAAR